MTTLKCPFYQEMLMERIKTVPEPGVKRLLYEEAAKELRAILRVKNLLDTSSNRSHVEVKEENLLPGSPSLFVDDMTIVSKQSDKVGLVFGCGVVGHHEGDWCLPCRPGWEPWSAGGLPSPAWWTASVSYKTFRNQCWS